MKDGVKISIIVAAYNAAASLSACLESAINQTLANIEILVVDDGSTDNSLAIMLQYAKNDQRIKVQQNPTNRSILQSRKSGVELARGEYIMFLDADDTLQPLACEKLAAVMDEVDVDILQFGVNLIINPETTETSQTFIRKHVEPYPGYIWGKAVFEDCFKSGKYGFSLVNKIIKTRLCKLAFAETRLEYCSMADDLYTYFILSWYGKSYLGRENKYYNYNFGTGISTAKGQKTLADFRKFCLQSEVARACRDFLVRHKKEKKYRNIWKSIDRRLLKNCVLSWLNDIADSEGAEAFDILVDSWGCNKVMFFLQYNLLNRLPDIIEKSQGANTFDHQACDINLVPYGLRKHYGLVKASDTITPTGFNKLIPIVMALNDNYVSYAGVAITSIIKNCSPQNYYRLYIMHTDISVPHITMLEKITTSNCEVKCRNISGMIQENEALLFDKGYFSKEALFRFYSARLFSDFDFVIYLDADIIVEADIAEIIPPALDNKLMAAVRNPLSEVRAESIKRDFALTTDDYFNSGVLVINIRKWLEENIEEKCFAFLKVVEKEKLVCPDQDILCMVGKGRVYFLDYSWNYLWHFALGSEELRQLYKAVIEEVGEQYKIIHYTSRKKPWDHPDLPLAQNFWKYAKSSVFYQEILAQQDFRVQEKKLLTKLIRRGSKTGSWAFAKLRGGYRCVKEHGLSYTLPYALLKLRRQFTRKN